MPKLKLFTLTRKTKFHFKRFLKSYGEIYMTLPYFYSKFYNALWVTQNFQFLTLMSRNQQMFELSYVEIQLLI